MHQLLMVSSIALGYAFMMFVSFTLMRILKLEFDDDERAIFSFLWPLALFIGVMWVLLSRACIT